MTGEVYGVDEKMLDRLDEFESHPRYYVRLEEEVDLTYLDGRSERRNAWVYFLNNYKTEFLNKPCLSEYSSKGAHGLEYRAAYLRMIKDTKHHHWKEVQPNAQSNIDAELLEMTSTGSRARVLDY